jgi:hypothetical protein
LVRFVAALPAGVATLQAVCVDGQSLYWQAVWVCIQGKGEENMDVSGFRQTHLIPRRLSLLLGAIGLALTILAASASAAAADRPSRCSGSFESPGVLAGTYSSNVVVEGACVVNAGPALIEGNLTVSPGAVVLADFSASGSKLTVEGNLKVQHGATLILGCEAKSFDFPCLGDPNASSHGSVSGNLSAQQPLGVVVHSSTIDGNVQEVGGGGGFTCSNGGPTVGGFHVFGEAFGGLPVFSDYSDSTIHRNLGVIGLTSCYLGVAREHVGGNVDLINNQLADPDAAEILENHISGNLLCEQNSQVWDSFEAVPAGPLFPRVPDRNEVSGHRVGQCVLASAETEGGPLGGPSGEELF